MLVRKCAKGNKVYIFKPRTKENVSYKFSDNETVSFDAQNKSYIVTSDGAVVKRTNSWITAQSSFLKESQDDIQKLEVGKHTLINGVATEIK
tara:strand:+ start:1611 stop:1886 length:276 start_codon:yes stop_codon:yes gene_type:complete